MEYQDFTVDIQSEDGGLFATVIDAPLPNRPKEPFSLPLEKPALQALLESADKLAVPGGSADLSPADVGQRLYTALFTGELATLFDGCRSSRVPGRTGLRLRLRFRSDDPQADDLTALPWEWLWDSRISAFLSTDLATPVVRDIITNRPWDTGASRDTPIVDPPLRILLVDASPADQPALDLEKEIASMIEAVGPLMERGEAELLRLRYNTPETLRNALREEPIHILHFMGHGGYHSASGFGAVFFETPDRKKDQVGGVVLADCLKSIPDLRLVILNACKTARWAGRTAARRFSGVASAIVERTGMPAVVAHQYAISDKAAIEFTKTFYGRVAAGDSVEEALTELRLLHRRHSPEWATPVLYLTTSSGRLFTVKPAKGQFTVRVLDQSQREESPVRLGIRSFAGWGGDMEARNDAVLDLTKYFNPELLQGRFILQREWWQEKVFPELRAFLLDHIGQRRPLLLDLAAHSSIAFAAGWVLDVKSGLDVRVRQRVANGEFEWSPNDGSEGGDLLWLDRQDIEPAPGSLLPDVALSLAVSRPGVSDHVQEFIRSKNLPVGRIIDAVIAPEPGATSVHGGAHALRLAQALLHRLQMRHPHERSGSLHLFCAGPNALLFYMGQLSRSFESIVLYEFPFGAKGNFGRYQRSIELPEERAEIPWED